MIDFQGLSKAISSSRKMCADNLTIGKMLEKLNSFHDDEQFIFSNGTFFDGTYDSYRGYYEDLYIGYSNEDKGFNTIGKLKQTLHKALDHREMYGYKGGTFAINNDTLIWLAQYGYTGNMIVDVQKVGEHISVIVKEEQ